MTDEDKKERARIYSKKYYETHKKQCIERSKKWQEERKDEFKEYKKQWDSEHKEYYKQKFKEYYQKNSNKLLEKAKKWRKQNPQKIKEYYENLKQNCVYAYRDIDTNEIVYIGSTGNIVRRVQARKCKRKSNIPFDNLYKNSPEKYKLEILCETETREQAYEIEYEYINEFKPKYNIRKS